MSYNMHKKGILEGCGFKWRGVNNDGSIAKGTIAALNHTNAQTGRATSREREKT